jgi:integrase
MALTDTAIKKEHKPRDKVYRVADGKGLCLEVRPNGAKLWRYRYRLDGKASMFSLGPYPEVSLEDARAGRKRCRKLVEAGIHPVQDKKAKEVADKSARANTFRAVCKLWLAENKAHWSEGAYENAKRGLKRHLYSSLGDTPIRQVTAPLLRDAIQKTAETAPTMAIKLRDWSSAVFRYAVRHELADHDPAAALKGLVKRPEVRHNPPLGQKDIPKLLARLDKYGGMEQSKIAVRLLLLTFVRTIELRAAEWSEIDFDTATWRIPKERMKKRIPHIVPLSTQAVEQLRALHERTGKRQYLFPNVRRPATYISNNTVNRVLQNLGFKGQFSAHGFRSTASTILNEMGYRPDLIERQLAHTEKNRVRASYNQAQYLDERRLMMQAWADYLDNLKKQATSGNVITAKFGEGA